MKAVTITEDKTKPYYTCPGCKNGNITRAFQVCIDCKARIAWERNEDMPLLAAKVAEIRGE